jgi:DNA repair protein RecO (recombination protein O)
VSPRSYNSQGIILSRRSFSEADRILTVFSKSKGKVSLMAKGVRKPKSRKRGSIEVFSEVEYSAAKGKNLDIMTEVEIIDSFPDIRKSLKKVSVAYFYMETIGRLSNEGEENRALYGLLKKYLKRLVVVKKLKQERELFIKDTLTLLGYWPKGRAINNADRVLEEIAEKELSSVRVGKKMLT